MFEREGKVPDVAVVGSRTEVMDQIAALAEAGVTDFAPSEFCLNRDEWSANGELLVELAADFGNNETLKLSQTRYEDPYCIGPISDRSVTRSHAKVFRTSAQTNWAWCPTYCRPMPSALKNPTLFTGLYNELMLADSGLTKLEREMIAVVVSSINRCFYRLTAHGAGGKELSGNPILGEQLVMNYRTAELDARQRAMLDFDGATRTRRKLYR